MSKKWYFRQKKINTVASQVESLILLLFIEVDGTDLLAYEKKHFKMYKNIYLGN